MARKAKEYNRQMKRMSTMMMMKRDKLLIDKGDVQGAYVCCLSARICRAKRCGTGIEKAKRTAEADDGHQDRFVGKRGMAPQAPVAVHMRRKLKDM
jgi:hypothetical protein